ncbi:GNAT family N-acetyltransferase [Clostridium sp. YIM B02505]|uniref:GNAT family N-acetyltransferase n=1 Tax=Clostridium yunnanense TaxID=2800325 RepID=A0ABS1EV19_9CLOT|nr:GNAT family protein [Clostridium yunnanense]MBK1813237.1 GNAT family N-acetyltransferase [Clostridium yunnanense]
MGISIELVSENNAAEIYSFEIDNREYFEEILPSRGEEYYRPEVFEKIIKEIIEEQNRNECYMHIIRNEAGKMVGRINFFSIRGENIKTAELGYRIGENDDRKGYATEAVEIAIDKGFKEYNFKKIEAGTASDNIGSQRVLEKNQFVLVKKIEKHVQLNDKWIDSFIYEINK